MFLSSSSTVAVRFLASIKEGQGLKASARDAGVNKEVGYRWLRHEYLVRRRRGQSVVEVVEELGLRTSRLLAWEADVGRNDDRHHLRVDAALEAKFWTIFDQGGSVADGVKSVGVSRSTGYRWMGKRFDRLRLAGATVRSCRAQLRLTVSHAQVYEKSRLMKIRNEHNAAIAGQHRAMQASHSHAERAMKLTLSGAQRLRAERTQKYWQLMRDRMSNIDACTLLGVNRRTGTRLRRSVDYQIPRLIAVVPSGRYLSARERLHIADLLRLGHSMRRIASELGRHPSTIKRELDRHRNDLGKYLPHTANHDAHLQRARPKVPKLVANTALKQVVQRKLNRSWSPEEICGWMRKTYVDDPTMRLSVETIYRALLLRGDHGLHKRYATKLRTGRRIRKKRWSTRVNQGSRIRNMKMIDQRPPEVETRLEAGHWEGDLIIGLGSASAMMTLRERKTHYGIIVNLPEDHTAASVNEAAIAAFATLPPHLKRTLTWDQGVEMSSHEELTRKTGVPVYFAERASPWQRGANENFNGLARQYFPKRTDLTVHTAKHVARVMRELNERPRKTLDYDTPAARLKAERDTPQPMLR